MITGFDLQTTSDETLQLRLPWQTQPPWYARLGPISSPLGASAHLQIAKSQGSAVLCTSIGPSISAYGRQPPHGVSFCTLTGKPCLRKLVSPRLALGRRLTGLLTCREAMVTSLVVELDTTVLSTTRLKRDLSEPMPSLPSPLSKSSIARAARHTSMLRYYEFQLLTPQGVSRSVHRVVEP